VTVVGEELEHQEAFPRLTGDLLAVLEAAGERRTFREGEGAMAVRMIHQYLRVL
jgi:hypothetical protein